MATITVSAGQTVSGQSFTSGTTLLVAYGGTSTSNFVGNGIETVSGVSFDDTVSGSPQVGAALQVESGAIVTGPTILGTASLSVAGAASVVGAVFSGTPANVIDGTLDAASVGNGAVVDIEGAVLGGVVTSGGEIKLDAYAPYGYQASGVTVGTGGTLDIGLSEAVGTVLSGGTATVTGEAGYWFSPEESGQAIGTQVLAGGVLTISNQGFDSGTVIGPGGTEHLKPDANSVGVVISGGTLELDYDYIQSIYFASKANGQEDGPVTFAGNGGTLRDDGLIAPASVISGFNATDRILLTGIAADPHATLTVSGDIATVSAGGQSYAIDIVGASGLALTLGIGTNAGNIDIGIACYCAGTAILTDEGERPVETIAPGDLVVTADGRSEPVVWVGRRSYAGRFLQGRTHLLPIRIRAGALGCRLPRRDLLVSPNHALLLDGVLVQAEALVDGRRITVEQGCGQVTYCHIELAHHDVILAEGAAAETFVDDRSRGIFQASAGTPGTAASYCAPRLADGFAVEAIRRRLAA